MDCLEFRKQIGANPTATDKQVLAHEQACPACAAFASRARALDRRLLEALRVPLADDEGNPYQAAASISRFADRSWTGLAASMVLGLGLALLTWWSAPHGAIAQDLVAHVRHEEIALVSTDARVPYGQLDEVLRRSGTTMPDGTVPISYARSCMFRGRLVPHLVVQGENGPVTVMILPDVKVKKPTTFAEQGYFGTILPAAAGSIAVIAGEESDLEEVSEPINESLHWDI